MAVEESFRLINLKLCLISTSFLSPSNKILFQNFCDIKLDETKYVIQ